MDQARPARTSRPARTAQAPRAPRKRYIGAVDGLRTFAVAAVVLYHLDAPFARGGLLGVTVFFVISGYLITGLLAAEWRESGTIALGKFWMRRVRRLFPAIFTVIAVMAALFTVLSPVLLTKMRPDIVPGLFWFTNWWYIVRDVSYFDALGSPSPLTHFWSLAIEEQFYLVWPLLLLGACKLGADSKLVRRGCLVLAGASALAMALLYDPAGDPSRVYYGTDTRAFSLLIGAWLSYVWPGVELTDETTRGVSAQAVRLLDAAGGVAFAGLLALCVLADGMSPFMYYGGILLASVLSAVLIAALVHPRSALAHVAESKPLVWAGLRSYGMYLWHFPIILLLGELCGIRGGYPWWFCLAAIALTVAAAAASFTFIEDPIRKGAIGRFFKAVAQRQTSVADLVLAHVPQAAAVAVVAAVAIGGIALVPETHLVPQDEIVSTGEAVDAAMDVSDAPRTFEGYSPLLIGDSVPAGADVEFASAFPHGLNDSYVGRQPFQAAEVLADYVAQDAVGKVVVVASFSNSTVRDGDLDAMLAAAGDRQLYLVNTYNTDGFMDDQNAQLAAFAEAHDNVHVIDWAGYAAPYADDWIYPDGTHLKPGAYQIYFGLIQDAVAADLNPDETGLIEGEAPLPDSYPGGIDAIDASLRAAAAAAQEEAPPEGDGADDDSADGDAYNADGADEPDSTGDA